MKEACRMKKSKPDGIWQKAGSGNPPAIWNVSYISAARKEAEKLLTNAQYWHVADQIREIAACTEPSRCETVNVGTMESFFYLKEKGGPLGKTNLRVFFYDTDY